MLRYEADLEFSKLFLTVNFDRNLLPFLIFKHNTVDIGGRSNRRMRLPFTILAILVFVGFGIFFDSNLHSQKHFALPLGCMSPAFLMKTLSIFLTQNALKGLPCSQSFTSHLQ